MALPPLPLLIRSPPSYYFLGTEARIGWEDMNKETLCGELAADQNPRKKEYIYHVSDFFMINCLFQFSNINPILTYSGDVEECQGIRSPSECVFHVGSMVRKRFKNKA